MAITIELTANVELTANNTAFDFEANRIAAAILNTKGLHHKGAVNKVQLIQGKLIICITIEGVMVQEKDMAFLTNLFRNTIKEQDLPCGIRSISSTSSNDEVMFLSERYIPSPSVNSVLLKQISSREIPDRYCCSLLDRIMDTPCYDVRYPQYKFELNCLQHHLNLRARPRHPQANVQMRDCHIEIDYELRGEINSYVKECRDRYNSAQKTLLLTKFRNASDLNQALRRAASVNDTTEDIKRLISIGADLDSRDDGRLKRTALHVALNKKRHNNVRYLLYLGAKVDIPDAAQNTFLDLFQESSISGKDLIMQDLVAFNYVSSDYQLQGALPASIFASSEAVSNGDAQDQVAPNN